MKWKFIPGDHLCAALSVADDFVISHRPQRYILSYRPTGHHFHVGDFDDLVRAKKAAEEYSKPNLNECLCHVRGIGCKVA